MSDILFEWNMTCEHIVVPGSALCDLVYYGLSYPDLQVDGSDWP